MPNLSGTLSHCIHNQPSSQNHLLQPAPAPAPQFTPHTRKSTMCRTSHYICSSCGEISQPDKSSPCQHSPAWSDYHDMRNSRHAFREARNCCYFEEFNTQLTCDYCSAGRRRGGGRRRHTEGGGGHRENHGGSRRRERRGSDGSFEDEVVSGEWACLCNVM